MKPVQFFSTVFCLLVLLNSCKHKTDYYSRGVGIYPGNPREDFSPTLLTDTKDYRNIARLRPAYHSSSYDYNLTAQLITDGIIINEMPDYISVSSNKGVLPKNEREWLVDNNSLTEVNLSGTDIWVQLELNSGKVPEISRIKINGSLEFSGKPTGGWAFACSGSNDGITWNELAKVTGNGLPGEERINPFAAMLAKQSKGKRPANPFASFFAGPYGSDSTAPKPSFSFRFGKPKTQRLINQSFEFKEPVAYHLYRVTMSAKCAEDWRLGDFDLYNMNTKLNIAPSGNFKSAWMSAGTGEEWVYVDLGASSSFDKIKLYWINKAEKGSIQVSTDAKEWSDIVSLPGNADLIDTISLQKMAEGRFVRVLMTKPSKNEKYVLSELEIFGKGGLVPQPKPNPPVTDTRLNLAAGNWMVQRASEVNSTGEQLSQTDFATRNWITATVPGTVLVSYWNAGALPNPNFGDNQLMVSESFFNSDFWYRDEFEVPSSFRGEKMFLNFDGINWKAEVFVNGKKT
ncbi:MAG TPA: discoidin domain-containing protein, partial [Bacteroidales bacterium]|nr:discoidin domain-containing protein [Bacteroidales bacterium]